MADPGDQIPRFGSNERAPEKEPVTPSPPGIIVTPAEGSTRDEEAKSPNDLLQASYDTEEDGALFKVHSEPTADADPKPEEKPLVSPEDDDFDVSKDILSRPVSPIEYDQEDEKSVTSSCFSDSESDSDKERRDRARRSSTDRDMSPSRTFTTRFASLEHIEKESSERRRSKENLAKGARRHATKSKSPLAIKSITRVGETVTVTSPTHGTVTITDPKVVEELDKSMEDGQFTLSPVKRALSISQDAQDAIERAFQEKEILRLAETYKNGPKHTPPPVPARPDSLPVGVPSADAEAQFEGRAVPNSQKTKLPGVSVPAETGTLHRRPASTDVHSQFLMQRRYDLIHSDLRILSVNPSHRTGGWTNDDLWNFMRAQENKILSIVEVLHKNKLNPEIEGMITLQKERKFVRSELKRMQSEFELQTIANEQRIAELENDLLSAEFDIERSQALQTIDQSREAILNSPDKLSAEANEALAKVEKHAEVIDAKHEEVCKGMDELRSQLDLTQQLKDDNKELCRNMEQLENQVVFYDHQNEKLKQKMDEQKEENDKIIRAYKVLQQENAQLKTSIQNLQKFKKDTEDDNTDLKIRLDRCQNAQAEHEGVEPVVPYSKIDPVDSFISNIGTGVEEESKTLRDSNSSLSGKVSALERLLASTREESVKYKELYNAAEEQRVWSFAHYATLREPWPIASRETIAQLIVTVVNDNRQALEQSYPPAVAALSARDLQFERTGLVEDAPVSGLLARDQVVTWLAVGMGLRSIFEEIRALGLHLDGEAEREILRVLIEQGLCYGNYDVFSTFVFADKPFLRKEFIARQTDMITVMDELEKKMLKTETDLKLANNRVAELEQTNREQSIKLEEQEHDLKQARQALETWENHHDDPEGALNDLIELQTTHANLREEFKEVEDSNKELRDEIAYYEKEIVEARAESEALGFTVYGSTDQVTCNVLAHRDLEERIRDLEKQKREFVEFSRDQEVAAAQMPDSPACPHCHKMRGTIKQLHEKLREQKKRASQAQDDAIFMETMKADGKVEEVNRRWKEGIELLKKQNVKLVEMMPRFTPLPVSPDKISEDISDNSAGSPPLSPPVFPPSPATAATASNCSNCAFLLQQLNNARRQSKESGEQLRKAQNELADASKEIQTLHPENGFSSPSSTSTAPTSTGAFSVKISEKDDRIKELETLLEQAQQSLSEKIGGRLTGDWLARKLAAPPAAKEDDLWDSFDVDGNVSKLVSERTKLGEQNAALQRNLDLFEAAAKIWEDEANVTAAQIENAESVALNARIENLRRQVEVIPALEARISSLAEEKKDLVGMIEYLDGDKKPECCIATKIELQKEIDAHAVTKRDFDDAVDAAATNLKGDSCEQLTQELFTANSNVDPCKGVKDELEALKIDYADLKEALRDTSIENENTKRILKQARIEGSKIKITGNADLEDPCKEIREELGTANTRLNKLQRLLEEEKAKKLANSSAQQQGELIHQIRELEEQIIKTRSAHEAQAKIEELEQRIRDDAVKITELQFEIGKLETTSKVYVLAGDRHEPPQNDHECKDTIMELIAAQTQLKGLIDDHRLDAPAKKSEPVEEKKEDGKEEPKRFIRGVIGVLKKFTRQSEADAEIVVSSPVEETKKEETPAPEEGLDTENDPCSIYKKQLKDVKKQVDAFEMLTLYKEKFLREQEIVEKKDKENMQLKNKLEIVLNDAPVSLRKRLTEALEANRKQANIIGCNEIVAAQHHKEMTALRKKLEILVKPDQVMTELMTKNFELEKTLDKAQGKFFKANLESGKKLNFLGRQLSELYAERETWRNSKTLLSRGLWSPAESAKNSKSHASTAASPERAEAKTSESPSKTTESAPKTTNYETGEDFRGTPENPWPKITYDCWPQSPPRLQKTFDNMYDANEKLYNNPVYVMKDRVPNHPKPDITGLWTEVQNTRWRLSEPKKLQWYQAASNKFNECAENEYFLPALWAMILALEYLGYNHYTLPTLNFIFGRERGPHSSMLRWASLIILFFLLYTWWLWHLSRGICGKSEDGHDSDDQPPKEDPCKDVKKELADAKTELETAKESSDKDKDKKDDSKKDDSNKDNSDSCKDIRNELATTTAKLNDAQAQLNGEKSVIDWKNDKRSNSQWEQLKNTKFWEMAGIPRPRFSDAITFEEYQRNGGVAVTGVSGEPSVHVASQIETGSGPAPPSCETNWLGDDFLSAHLDSPNFEIEHPTPDIDAWVDYDSDADEVDTAQGLGATLANATVGRSAVDHSSLFGSTAFFTPAEADLKGLGATTESSGSNSASAASGTRVNPAIVPDDQDKSKTPAGLDSAVADLLNSVTTNSTNAAKFDPNVEKTAFEWIQHINAEMAKDPNVPKPARLLFTYSSTDLTRMKYADFVQNRLLAPQSVDNIVIWLSPFRGGDGVFEPHTPPDPELRRFRDDFAKRRMMGQVCCEVDYQEKTGKKLLRPDPSAYETPKVCKHGPLERHGTNHMGSPFARPHRPAANPSVSTVNGPYAPDQATLASAWRQYLRKHRHLRRFVSGRNPWERIPAAPGSVIFQGNWKQRKIMANAYGVQFPSHAELTAWHAAHALLPPTDKDLADVDERQKGFSQIPAVLKVPGGSAATVSPGPAASIPAAGAEPQVKASAAFSHVPEHLKNFRVGVAKVPDSKVLGKWPDPCKDVKEKLAKAQKELDLLKSGDDCAEVRKRVKQLYEELQAKSILYDPVREQLTRVEAELAEEKKEHEAAKEKVALANPKTVKTNEQQKADAKAHQVALDAAAKEAEKRISAAEEQADQYKRRADEFRRALELEKKRRLAAPSVEEEVVIHPINEMTALRFWITLALSVVIALWIFPYTTLDHMAMSKNSTLSLSEILWYDTVESTRGYHGLIIVLTAITLVVLLIWAATLASADWGLNPYPDYFDDHNDDGNSGGDGKGGDEKKDDFDNKGDGSYCKKNGSANGHSLKSPLDFFFLSSALSSTVKRSTPTFPKSPRSPTGFQTTRQQTWKHSYILSVSTEPVAGTSAGNKIKDISPYCKELEDRVEVLERELLAARTKVSTLTQSAISSVDLRPQAGPRADQKRQALAHSAISSVSSAPCAAKEVVKRVEKKVESTASDSFSWWSKITSLLPQISPVAAATNAAHTADSSTEEKDPEEYGNDDYPPPGSFELKFIIAQDLAQMRERQLEQAARDLENCHEANKALRKRFYDERDGWEAERKKVEELKKAHNNKPDTQASSGDVDHSECNKRINDLVVQYDKLRDAQAESDSRVADYEKDGDQRVAQHEEMIKNLKNMMQGIKKDAEKRQDIAEMRKLEAQQLRNQLGDEQMTSRKLMARLKDVVAQEKKAREELETVKNQLSECEETRRNVNGDQFLQEKLDRAIEEAEIAKNGLNRWINQIELNKTYVLKDESSDPEVARLQRFLFERTKYIEMLIEEKKSAEESLEWYRNRLRRAFEGEDHEQCRSMEKLYKQQAERAEKERDDARDDGRKMWYDVVDERSKTYLANEEKRAAEKRVKLLEKEKEALAKQLEEKSKVCPPETKDDGGDTTSLEVPSKALRDARLATVLAEAESRKLKLERDRLARENALLGRRLERDIDTLEHPTEPKTRGALPLTPISTDYKNKTKNQRLADIITNFENLEDPFYDGLVTGGLLSRLPKFNPNRLLDILGHPHSQYTPRRAPIPSPEPPYSPFEPLTPEGRRRSAERMISDPEREKALAEERAYLAAVRAVEYAFEEKRSDAYALFYTLLRKSVNIPVRDAMAALDRIPEAKEEEQNEENTENIQKMEANDEIEESSDSGDSSLEDEEFSKRYNMTPTPLPRNRRTIKGVYHSP
ncbi:hypothetical protein QM012_000042 [Aureobasidium pullulans]|uniref:Uncharacterized protein n=1 Tax=Aureobasidium pullulans TaxID=5580 RepID=A0ABR0TV85_AURPU